MPYAIVLKKSKRTGFRDDPTKIWVQEGNQNFYVDKSQRSVWKTREEVPPSCVNGLWEEIVWVEDDLA